MSEKRISDHIRERLQARVGLSDCPNVQAGPVGSVSLSELRRTEWSSEFEEYMRSLLVIGAIRYGRMGDPFKAKYDYPEAMVNRVKLYQKTGNLEWLVDVANFAMLEFVDGDHPRRHVRTVEIGEEGTGVGDSASAVRVLVRVLV